MAHKITEILINLPIEDIKLFMQDWSLFNTRIQEASELLDQKRKEELYLAACRSVLDRFNPEDPAAFKY